MAEPSGAKRFQIDFLDLKLLYTDTTTSVNVGSLSHKSSDDYLIKLIDTGYAYGDMALNDGAGDPSVTAEWRSAVEADLGHDLLHFAFDSLAADEPDRKDTGRDAAKSADDKFEPESWFAAFPGDDGEDDEFAFADPSAAIETHIHGDESDNFLEGTDFDDYIYGYGGNDTIYGNGGTNVVYAGSGNDDVFGGDDTDFILDGDGNDHLYGGGGTDYIHGGAGEDFLYGGLGDDQLVGDTGNDHLFGEEGDDKFFDNPGNDTYTGGEGADIFSFIVVGGLWEGGGGEDIILDFELGVDTLEIGNLDPSFGELSFADYVDQHAFGQADPGVVIEWENGLIRLPGVSVADLNPWDIDLW